MKTAGFTLIELMICIAIMAILIAMSYPLYSHHLTVTKRQRAELALQQLATRLEEFYSDQNTYAGSSEVLHLDDLIPDHSYKLAIEEATDTHYLISVQPLGPQMQMDEECGTLTLDEIGKRTISGKGTIADCWPK